LFEIKVNQITIIKMSLELLIGPMFAGKSSAIQSIIRRHQALGWNVFVVTHSMDTRYSSEPAIVNHDKVMMPARATNSLMSLVDDPEYISSRLVVIEEAQFFPDLVPFVLQSVDKAGKHAVVVGLDGDAERRPFGRVLDLVPYCDRVTKLTAMCKMCKDGTPAIFTFAAREDAVVAANDGRPCIGADEKYVPLCRKHFNSSHDPALLLTPPSFEQVLNTHAC
jgi:thymidine kinase